MVVGVMFKVVCARFVARIQSEMRVMCPFNNVLRHFLVLAIQPCAGTPAINFQTLSFFTFSGDVNPSADFALPNKLYLGLKLGRKDVTYQYVAHQLLVTCVLQFSLSHHGHLFLQFPNFESLCHFLPAAASSTLC
jgi:hypothetical protein